MRSLGDMCGCFLLYQLSYGLWVFCLSEWREIGRKRLWHVGAQETGPLKIFAFGAGSFDLQQGGKGKEIGATTIYACHHANGRVGRQQASFGIETNVQFFNLRFIWPGWGGADKPKVRQVHEHCLHLLQIASNKLHLCLCMFRLCFSAAPLSQWTLSICIWSGLFLCTSSTPEVMFPTLIASCSIVTAGLLYGSASTSELLRFFHQCSREKGKL